MFTTTIHPGKTSRMPLEWGAAEDRIRKLYIDDNLTLREVRAEMKKEGFEATEKMFKDRFDSWGLAKKASKQDWLAVALLRQDHPECHFVIHNKIKRLKDYRRHLQAQKIGEAKFLQKAIAAKITIPSYIRCVTPHHGSIVNDNVHRSDDSLASSEIQDEHQIPIQSPYLSSPELPPTQGENGATGRPNPSHDGNDPMLFEQLVTDMFLPVAPSTTSSTVFAPPFNPGLGEMIANVYDPAACLAFPALDDVSAQGLWNNWNTHTLSHIAEGKQRQVHEAPRSAGGLTSEPRTVQASFTRAIWSANAKPLALNNIRGDFCAASSSQHDELDNAASFQAACMAACMYGAYGKYHELTLSFAQAASTVRKMCLADDPLLLSAIDSTLVWLRVYAEGSLPKSLLEHIHQAAMEAFNVRNSICSLLEWMTAAAGGGLPDCRIKSTMLRKVCEDITQTYGEEHGNSIVAGYCLGFQLLLETLSREAETHFRHLHETALRVLGPKALQTNSALAALSRAQTRQNKHEDALKTLNRCLEGTPPGFGLSHRFGVRYRRALVYKKLGLIHEMLEDYRVVVAGWSAMLGANHPSTQKAHASLVKALQENGLWDSHKDMVQRLLTEPQVDLTDEEISWRFAMLNMAQPLRDERESSADDE